MEYAETDLLIILVVLFWLHYYYFSIFDASCSDPDSQYTKYSNVLASRCCGGLGVCVVFCCGWHLQYKI